MESNATRETLGIEDGTMVVNVGVLNVREPVNCGILFAVRQFVNTETHVKILKDRVYKADLGSGSVVVRISNPVLP